MEHHEGAGTGGEAPITGGRSGGSSPGGRSRRSTGGAPDAADRLSALTHELRNLLDGSLRWIVIAERDLPEPGDADLGAELDRTRRQLDTVRRALVQMNELVRTSMSAGLSLGTPIMSSAARISMGEALDHAVDVARPRASSLGIELSISIDERAGPLPAGAMYSVMLNALHNAIDSIERRLGGKPGRGRIEARLGWAERGGVARVVFEVADDGVGPPDLTDPGGVFEPAFSTKEEGQGIGLALSRQIVLEMGGRIELLPRPAGPGAVLRVVLPGTGVSE